MKVINNLSLVASDIEEYFANLDNVYPDRHKKIHKEPCKGCPSMQGDDPEVRDIKASCSKENIAREFLFVCYKRNSKLCKGYCDYNDIDQDYLDHLFKEQ